MSENPEKKVGISVKPSTEAEAPAENESTDAVEYPASLEDQPEVNQEKIPLAADSGAEKSSSAVAFKAPVKPAHRAQAAPVVKIAAAPASSSKAVASHRPAVVNYDGDAPSLVEVIIDGLAAALAIAFLVLAVQQFIA